MKEKRKMNEYKEYKTRQAVTTATSLLYSFLELYEKTMDVSLIRSAIYALGNA